MHSVWCLAQVCIFNTTANKHRFQHQHKKRKTVSPSFPGVKGMGPQTVMLAVILHRRRERTLAPCQILG